MRMPLYKVRRAFPELDRLSNKQRARFVGPMIEPLVIGLILLFIILILLPMSEHWATILPESWHWARLVDLQMAVAAVLFALLMSVLGPRAPLRRRYRFLVGSLVPVSILCPFLLLPHSFSLLPNKWVVWHPVLSGVLLGLPPLGGWMVILVLRDILLCLAIRSYVNDTRCERCRYSMLGMPAADGRVICPECGAPFVLADHGMTPEDLIAPGNRGG